MDQAPETDTGAPDTEQQVDDLTPRFGDDDLGRLQHILLGDHARKTLERIETLEQALLGAIDDLRGEMRDRIKEVEGSLASEANVRTTALTNLTSRIDEEAKSRSQAIKQADKAATQAIAGLDSQFGDLASKVESDTASQTNALSELRSQVESDAESGAEAMSQLRHRLENEAAVRTAALSEVSNELQATETEISHRISATEQAIDSKIKDVRGKIADTATHADTKISRTELSNLLAKLAAEVDSE